MVTIKKEKVGRKKGGKLAVVILVLNMLIFLGSVLCFLGTYLNYTKLNNLDRNYDYRVQDERMKLELSNGNVVEMRFAAKSVRVYDAYKYSDRDSVMEILYFVREYAKENDRQIERTNAELVGEFRLHAALYTVGYQRVQTKDLDWDFVEDTRWYVNAFSELIGRYGL